MDLSAFYFKYPEHKSNIIKSTLKLFDRFAVLGLCNFDIKPGNVVVDVAQMNVFLIDLDPIFMFQTNQFPKMEEFTLFNLFYITMVYIFLILTEQFRKDYDMTELLLEQVFHHPYYSQFLTFCNTQYEKHYDFQRIIDAYSIPPPTKRFQHFKQPNKEVSNLEQPNEEVSNFEQPNTIVSKKVGEVTDSPLVMEKSKSNIATNYPPLFGKYV